MEERGLLLPTSPLFALSCFFATVIECIQAITFSLKPTVPHVFFLLLLFQSTSLLQTLPLLLSVQAIGVSEKEIVERLELVIQSAATSFFNQVGRESAYVLNEEVRV